MCRYLCAGMRVKRRIDMYEIPASMGPRCVHLCMPGCVVELRSMTVTLENPAARRQAAAARPPIEPPTTTTRELATDSAAAGGESDGSEARISEDEALVKNTRSSITTAKSRKKNAKGPLAFVLDRRCARRRARASYLRQQRPGHRRQQRLRHLRQHRPSDQPSDTPIWLPNLLSPIVEDARAA